MQHPAAISTEAQHTQVSSSCQMCSDRPQLGAVLIIACRHSLREGTIPVLLSQVCCWAEDVLKSTTSTSFFFFCILKFWRWETQRETSNILWMPNMLPTHFLTLVRCSFVIRVTGTLHPCIQVVSVEMHPPAGINNTPLPEGSRWALLLREAYIHETKLRRDSSAYVGLRQTTPVVKVKYSNIWCLSRPLDPLPVLARLML